MQGSYVVHSSSCAAVYVPKEHSHLWPAIWDESQSRMGFSTWLYILHWSYLVSSIKDGACTLLIRDGHVHCSKKAVPVRSCFGGRPSSVSVMIHGSFTVCSLSKNYQMLLPWGQPELFFVCLERQVICFFTVETNVVKCTSNKLWFYVKAGKAIARYVHSFFHFPWMYYSLVIEIFPLVLSFLSIGIFKTLIV